MAVGELARGEEKVKAQATIIKALSTGDVDKLVQQGLEDAKKSGFFDSILDEVYGLLQLVVIGLGLWVAVPLLYTMFVHRKVKKNEDIT